MRYKELKTVEIPKWGNYLRKQWRECFASHLSNEEQKLIGMDGFLWQLCSWGKVKCLEKEEAIAPLISNQSLNVPSFINF